MAHPKRKISKTRRDKRRTHYKATSTDCYFVTGEAHLYHRAYGMRGKMYRGQVVIDKSVAVA
jgi:large subunit ribosomal protein L32